MDNFGIKEVLDTLGIEAVNKGTSTGSNWFDGKGHLLESYSPVDGGLIGKVHSTTPEQYDEIIHSSAQAFKRWRMVPAPKRGEVIRQIGEELRNYKEPLGKLVSYEMGKSYQEGLGEVQ